MNLGAGHGGASGRYDRLRETAHDYAFVLFALGLADDGPSDAMGIAGEGGQPDAAASGSGKPPVSAVNAG